MSADNRLIIQFYNDEWFLWEGSCSFDYHCPPPNAEKFSFESDALDAARKKANEMSILEGGIQYLTNEEIISALRQELSDLKDPIYCPECQACGEDPCCSGSKCSKNTCLYGEHYADEYEYHKEMCHELYAELLKHSKEKAEEILGKCHDQFFPIKSRAK